MRSLGFVGSVWVWFCHRNTVECEKQVCRWVELWFCVEFLHVCMYVYFVCACVHILYLRIQTGTSDRTLIANLYVTSLIWHKWNGFCILISNSILILNGLTWYKLNLFSYQASFRKSISHWLNEYRLVIIKHWLTAQWFIPPLLSLCLVHAMMEYIAFL
jgi:hypothetical protein